MYWAVSHLVISKRAHHHRVHVVSTSCCTRHTPMHVTTARYSFERLGGIDLLKAERPNKNMFSSLSASAIVSYAVVAQNITYPHTYDTRTWHQLSEVKHHFACFGNSSSISHTQIPCQLGPEALNPKNHRGGGFLSGRGVFRMLF